MSAGYPKLVRDRIPSLMRAEGKRPVEERLTREQARVWTLRKLVEEAREALRAYENPPPRNPRKEVIAELADVEEALMAVRRTHQIMPNEVERARRKKASSKGSFHKLVLIRTVSKT
jgi:predicted house-cleaning noncanonical NTP pyrophosphatase (MazG superfamily)